MNKQGKNGIPYCDYTWNPVTGCLHGCTYCFARRIAERFNGSKAFPNGFEPMFHGDRLIEPRKQSKPSRIFVSDMGDLFGDWVPAEWINEVLDTVRMSLRHIYLFLTKNPKRYKEFEWPKNAWLGVSVENQAAVDERIPLLLQTPAVVRFISAEPLLGSLNLTRIEPNKNAFIDSLGGFVYWLGGGSELAKLDWVIVGGESGPGARPVHPDWVRSLRDQCQAAGVPFFFKQWGEWLPTGTLAEAKGNPTPGELFFPGLNYCLKRVGKKKAGRELDGRTWDEKPERMSK
ncbi:MAG: phage Gp37/Gp68 family protein [Desulfosporosinus sp.]